MATITASRTPEILIVGAGPSGLVLALSLLRNGVPVRIIEKNKTHRIGQRGAGLSPRSLELLESLGIIDEVYQRGIPVPMIRVYKMPEGIDIVKEFQATPEQVPTPTNPYPNFWCLGQDNLEMLIRTELKKCGCSVELDIELQSLEQSRDLVHVKLLRNDTRPSDTSSAEVEEGSYKWVIGADGAKGNVRKQLGLSFVGQTVTEQNFITADIKLEGFSTDKWCMWGDLADVLTAIRYTETPGLYNVLIGGSNLPNYEVISASNESLIQHIKRGTGNRDDIQVAEVVWMSPFRINIRMVDTFQKGRVFLTGDAGHVHSLTGGQGLNTGIQDSFNLGWKIALVAKGLATTSLLKSYSEERSPVVAEMLNITTALYKQTLTNVDAEKGWNRSGSIHQLGVNYRGSPIVVDQAKDNLEQLAWSSSSYGVQVGAAGIRAGDRAPDAPGLVKVIGQSEGAETRLFQLLSPARHTVVVFADKVEYLAVLDSLKGYSRDLVEPIVITGNDGIRSVSVHDIFRDRWNHAHNAYNTGGTTGIFVIRPDGVVGARIGSAKALDHYFLGISLQSNMVHSEREVGERLVPS